MFDFPFNEEPILHAEVHLSKATAEDSSIDDPWPLTSLCNGRLQHLHNFQHHKKSIWSWREALIKRSAGDSNSVTPPTFIALDEKHMQRQMETPNGVDVKWVHSVPIQYTWVSAN